MQFFVLFFFMKRNDDEEEGRERVRERNERKMSFLLQCIVTKVYIYIYIYKEA
jgi:hypothetical protein